MTPADIVKDKSWAFATIATTGNDERLAIEKVQVQRFGWSKNEPILRWICPVRSGKVGKRIVYSDIKIDSTLLSGKYMNLSTHFVRGARCVLSENLCTTLGYAKGTQGILEGLVWDEKDGDVPDMSKMLPGKITDVRQPRFVIMNVNDVLIPIGYSNDIIKIRGRDKKIRKISYRRHSFDLMFAVTYHKLQGVTLDKLILSINKHPNWRLRLLMSSLYVGVSRVHKLEELRVLPFNDDDVEYLTGLSRDPLLHDWINNYSKEGKWQYDGFAKVEEEMMKHLKMDLALVDDLSQLTLQECRVFLAKLDIVASGAKVIDLRNALMAAYSEGRSLLLANGGYQLRKKRIVVLKRLRKLGDRNKIKLKTLRAISKQLGVVNAGKLGKRSLLNELTGFEKSMGITPNKRTISQLSRGVLLNRNKVCLSAPKKKRKKTIRNEEKKELSVCQAQQLHVKKFKGLINLGHTCYFNSVIQCLLHCPVYRHAIGSLPEHALSIVVLRELRILFTRMTNSDSSSKISPSECLNAALNTPECKEVQMGVNDREEDVSEFLVRLLEHFYEELGVLGVTTYLTDIFKIQFQSTTTCLHCATSRDKKEHLWIFTLQFPFGHNEHAPASLSHTLDLYTLMDHYLTTEILSDYRCPECDDIRQTAKILKIVNPPPVLVFHLSRFTNGLQKIPNFVGFPRQLTIKFMRDGTEDQMYYRLTGLIVHTGQTIAYGHYFAYVLANGKWLKANDSTLTEVCWETVRTKEAYLLFYDRL